MRFKLRDNTPESCGSVIILNGIVMHVEQFVDLAEAIPGAIVFRVDIWNVQISQILGSARMIRTNGPPVSFYCSVAILEFDKFVTHKRPCGKVVSIELKRSLEILDGFDVFVSGREVISLVIVWPLDSGRYAKIM